MSEYDCIIATDPGVVGAFSVIRKNRTPLVHLMPTQKVKINKKEKKVYDVAQIVKLLEPYKGMTVIYVQEAVSARPGQGGVSIFGFGKSSGLTLGVAHALGFEVIEVSSMSWKKIYPEFKTDSTIVELKGKKSEFNKEVKCLKKQMKSIKDKGQKKENSNKTKELEKVIERINRQIKSRGKEIAREISIKKYPSLAAEFKLAKDDGKADSLLLGLYAKDKYAWGKK